MCLCSVAQTEDMDQIVKDTKCLQTYAQRGVAFGCFYYARCLQLGKGIKKNEEEALKFFKKVCNI